MEHENDIPVVGELASHDLQDPPPFSVDDELCYRCRRSRTFRLVAYRVAPTSYGWRSTIELRCARQHRWIVCSSRWHRHVPAGPWWWRLAVVLDRINLHVTLELRRVFGRRT